MKKVLAITLALVIVLSLAVTALAIDGQFIIRPNQPYRDGELVIRIVERETDNRNVDVIVLDGPEEENPTTGAPVVLPACGAVAVLAGVAYVVSKRK